MSVCSNIFVLFKNVPTANRLAELGEIISNRTGMPVSSNDYQRLMPVEDADLVADVAEDGSLNFWRSQRYSKLCGTPTIQGRLMRISYLCRHWDAACYPQGPAMLYALTMLVLLANPHVQGVWHIDDSSLEGNVTIPAMMRDHVHTMIDDFVAIGEMTDGRPTRYIRTEDGTVINT